MSNDADTYAELRRVADELFITADLKDWTSMAELFAKGPIEVDTVSLAGGEPLTMTAVDLIEAFKGGLHADKKSHHMTTNYRVTVRGDAAEVWAHGYAWNQVAGFNEGEDVWETWGNSRLGFTRAGGAWKLNAFRYYSTRTAGNDAVHTHRSWDAV
jgi:hypothetical protein